MTWEELLSRDDIVGGELQINEGGNTCRGPISEIFSCEDIFFFTLSWVAEVKGGGNGKWNLCRGNFIYPVTSKEVRPSDPNNGMISFDLPSGDRGTIFLKGTNTLDPDTIEGLASSCY